ncbi:hypothetical protein HYS94_01815 [Candidatus Daviesbacteria bacterium]|nr:hypothetical protein [Candidatus Daviesbacteria bacterium]
MKACKTEINISCECSGDSCSLKALESYRKFIWCDAVDCVWNMNPLPFKKYVQVNDNFKSLPNDNVKGLCTRQEIRLTAREVETLRVKHKLAGCAVRSDKRITGHMDWGKFPEGGNIPDPVDPAIGGSELLG